MINSFAVRKNKPQSSWLWFSMFPTSDPMYSLFTVEDIQGLGPVKASVNTTDSSVDDGTIFVSSFVPSRNIVITLGFDRLRMIGTGKTIAGLRQELYAYFLPKTSVRLRFNTDLPSPGPSSVFIDGYIESCEPSIFSKDPEVQISVICNYPYFKDFTQTVLDLAASGSISIPLEGLIPVGFFMDFMTKAGGANIPKLIVTRNADDFDDQEQVQITFNNPSFTGNNHITINTRPGERRIARDGGGVGTYTKTPNWLTLFPGNNGIEVTYPGQFQSMTFSYYKLHGGL